jgi:hypothetical protein
MVSEDELNRAVQKATVAERIAEEKMIAAEKVVVETTAAANKITEKYAKAVKESTDKVAEKIGRDKKRAEEAKLVAEVEAKRIIAEDIKKANAVKRAADRALKDAKEKRN